MAAAIGGLIGGSLGGRFAYRWKMHAIIGGFGISATIFIVCALVNSVDYLIACSFLIGFFMAIENIALMSMIHESCPSQSIGRVFSVWRLFVDICGGVSIIAAGYAADLVSAKFGVLAFGILTVAVILIISISTRRSNVLEEGNAA